VGDVYVMGASRWVRTGSLLPGGECPVCVSEGTGEKMKTY
jgi:hypothetical protein